MDPNERAARVYGQALIREGLIFGNLDRKIHFIDPDEFEGSLEQ